MHEQKDFPPIIYKYRSWNNDFHKKILLDNQVYLSPPEHFNDPFDCTIGRNFNLLDNDEKRAEFAHSIVQGQMDEILRRNETPENHYAQFKRRLDDDLIGLQAMDNENTWMMINERYGVLSLAEIWDSILMWAHYADLHKGFCVGFKEDLIRNSELFGAGGSVIYSDDFPEISPLNVNIIETAFFRTHYKAMCWEYEREYRLTTTFPERATDENRKVTIPNEFYSEIVLGIKCSNEHKKEIIAIAKNKKIPIYQCIKVPFKFLIQREQIG